ncbi:hypothetical protein C8Q79DRAFT_192382 [Trametes meyenii]|nr:hypothetical protein C8Q79DRAFT_192382 [Trametes meyenii]
MTSQQDAAVRLVTVNAQDPAIQYGGHWMDTTMQNSSSSKATTQPHNTATLPFGGTAVYLYGWVGPAGPPTPSIECYVDGNITTGQGPVNLRGSKDGVLNWAQQELCWQEGLADGNHTIKVIVTQATEEYSFIIDKLKFRLSAEQFQSLSGGAMANTSSTTEAAPSASPSSSQDPTSNSRPRSFTLAIVGGAVGAIGLLSLTVLALYLLSRRRKGQAYSVLSDSEYQKFETPISSPLILEQGSSAIPRHYISPVRKDSETGATYNPSTDGALSEPDPEKSEAWQESATTSAPTLTQPNGEEIPLDLNTYLYRSSRRISAVLLETLRRWTRNIQVGSGNTTRRSSSGVVIAVASRPGTPFVEPPPGYSERP